MSRSSSITANPPFVSRSAFDALTVEDVEDSEDEQQQEETPQTQVTSTEHTKPSKSQIKKAQKQARTERRKQLKASSKAGTANSSPRHTPSLEESIARMADGAADVYPLPTTHTAPEPKPTAEPPQEPAPEPEPEPEVSESSLPGPVINGDIQHVNVTENNSTLHLPSKLLGGEGQSVSQPDVEQALKSKLDPQEVERTKTRQSILTRTLWTFIMIGVFVALLLMGHVYMIMLAMLCQTIVYREVTALFSLTSHAPDSGEAENKRKKDPWSKTLNWYFFAVTNYFLYGESIIYYFKHVIFSDGQLLPFATNHRIISFTLYTIGFVGFVMSLRRGFLKQQFGLFCWVHMSLLLIVVSGHFIVNNILEGMIWFWVPASLVICNDIFAYVWGMTVGRTPLIKLSPKKTVEGFVGAFWSTLLFSVFWGSYFMRFNYMICPVHDLGVSAWSNVQCTPNPVFVWKVWQIWSPLRVFLSRLLGKSVTVIPYAPYQLHLLVFAVFASLVAPFGGFFASGFKRAFNIKDFGHSIPGHGGMTDRMDCQFLMGVFTYVYYSSLIREHHVSVGSILQMIVSGLTVNEQLELVKDLKKYMEGQGIMIV
ncbi:phosphatidate cytidylyltransferase [Suillus fuscotomentosus]|uniref:Phosphatidate cytidylyltransferase n=1 Tax=Suillus fuscotomentosus TaxID=1912939 RepID=A0AAD4E7D9_9AGAM|nr:phosphatidate cytidylyltransferase [Suillus fuscotomentosus]KAG1900661.1 phosphatidate cytidylyltransferase [Suillus fuscotomentosus]